jgi:GNAT superfamily N-acetyltransferase
MTDRLIVACRPAKESDKADMLELTRTIWDGNDYVPEVWDYWLADKQGQLVAAEYQGRVLGVGKITRLSEQDWWFEGLRVHPEFQGHGIASQMHDYMVETWLRIGSGTVRLGTNSNRYTVHHMCERLGFEKVAEFTFFIAPTESPDQSNVPEPYNPVQRSEIPEAMALISQSPMYAWMGGMLYLHWRWAPLRECYVEKMVDKGKIFWWRGRQGVLAYLEGSHDNDEKYLTLQTFACQENALPEFIQDYRHLAGRLGFKEAVLAVQPMEAYQSVLEVAGFRRDWDELLYIYAKQHPGNVV